MTPSVWTTRPEQERDIAAVRQVNLAAFPTPDEADLVDALRRDPAWLSGLSYVAESPDGTVAGYALLTRCHIGDVPALALAPVAVLPAHQRRGAGTAVVTALLDAARTGGHRLVVVLGEPDYYRRFGFVRASRYGIRPPLDWPDAAFRVLDLDAGLDLDAAPLDTGPPAGTVRYPAPFGIG